MRYHWGMADHPDPDGVAPPVVPVLDVSGVALQGPTVATRCPVRADLDAAPSAMGLRVPISGSDEARLEAGRVHEAAVLAAVRAGGVPVHEVPDGPAGQVQAATAALLAELDARPVGERAVVIGPWPADDPVGRRTGRPHLLVRDAAGRWLPVTIELHRLTRGHGPESTLDGSPPGRLDPDAPEAVAGRRFRTPKLGDDALELAHHRRLLEAAGWATAGEPARGGVIDRDGTCWWVDLDERRWSPWWATEPVSTLDRYDRAFAFRLEVIAHRHRRDHDHRLARKVVPVWTNECESCPWRAVCRRELEADDHVSLLPGSTYRRYLAHAERGVTTRRDLAELDWATAWVRQGDDRDAPLVDLPGLLATVAAAEAPDDALLADVLQPDPVVDPAPPEVATSPSTTPVDGSEPPAAAGRGPSGTPGERTTALRGPDASADAPVAPGERPTAPRGPDASADAAVERSGASAGASAGPPEPRWRRRGPTEPAGPEVALARLAAVGVSTVGDLTRLDARTGSYAQVEVGHLPTLIDQARASVAGRPFRRRGLERVEVRRADVEIDVDMENVDDGVYLWGTFTTVAAGTRASQLGLTEGYRPFHSWDPMDPAVAARIFAEFWTWLTDVQVRCASVGASLAAYCYTTAEHVKMRQIVSEAPPTPGLPTLEEVDALVASAQWVDLYALVRDDLVVGHGKGLKKIAPLAGFGWQDDDPSGQESMVWHHRALTDPDPAERTRQRTRILTYNEDDVRATLAVRRWLDDAELPAIADWTPTAESG